MTGHPLSSIINRLRLGWIVCALAICAGASAQDAEIERTIAEIRIEGTKRLDPQRILDGLPVKVGDELADQEPAETIKRINDFLIPRGAVVLSPVVEEGEEGLTLALPIREFPLLDEVEVEGNDELRRVTVKRVVPFEKGDPLPLDAAFQVRDAVEELYRDEGFTDARVRVTRLPSEREGRENLTINVDEGTRVKIKRVEINGNENISSFRIKTLMLNKGSFLFFANYYDDEEFDVDLENIATYYRSRGHLDVKVERGEFLWGEGREWVIPAIDIAEGPLYTVEKIQIIGYRIYGPDEIYALFDGLEGEIFNGKKFGESLRELRRMYGDDGYIDVQLQTRQQIDHENRRVSLGIEITENERVRIRDMRLVRRKQKFELDWTWLDKITEKISPPIKEEVVLKETRMEPGQVYRTLDEVRAERRLRRLNIFERVDIKPVITEDPELRDVEVEVDELGVGSFVRVGIAYNDESGAVLFLGYLEQNLFGEAKYLKFDLGIGERSQSVRVTYAERYKALKNKIVRSMLWKDHEGEFFDEARKTYSFYFYETRRDDFDEGHLGGTVTWLVEPDEFRTRTLRTKLEYVNLDRDNPEISDDFDADYPVASVRRGWAFDSTDDDYFPTEGREWGVGVEGGYADGALAKLTGRAEYYRGLLDSERWIWATKARGGLLPYDADTIGLTERFFLGGDSDLRGFRSRGAGPKDPASDEAAIGGATKLLVQNELRYKINDRIFTLAFIDVGSLGEGVLELETPRLSAGAGVRFRVRSPIPIFVGVDIAKSIIDEDEDETRVIHFRLRPLF